MYFLKTYLFLLFLLLAQYPKYTSAQSLNGKVIYISPLEPVMLKFRSVITNFSFTNKDVASQFQTRITNNKNLSVNSTVDNFKSTSLIVTEGENTHLFILEYKAALDIKNESLYDFSTKAKLKAEADKIAETSARDSTKDVSKNQATTTSVSQSPATKSKALTPKEIEENFLSLKTKANNAFSSQAYDEAKQLYQSALQIKPGDLWCLSQIEVIGNKKITVGKQEQQRLVLVSYQTHLHTADSAYNKKLYDIARFEYNQALNEKPNDIYAISQLKKIDLAIKNDSYNSFMNIGRQAISEQLFDNATLAFNEVLKIRPNDADAKKELGRISQLKAESLKKQKADILISKQQNLYTDTLSLADNLFEAGMYEEARKKYKQADRLRPGLLYHATKIASIDSILATRKNETNKVKQDSVNTLTYNKEIEKGNKALETKDFKKARAAFQMAQSLKPGEKYPVERISSIDVMISQSEETKKAEIAEKAKQENLVKQYNFNISRGNAALNSNEYKTAKDFFSKALDLKPNEKFPATQLAVVNRKLEDIMKNQKYDEFIHNGDSTAFITKNYLQSLKWYDSALSVKLNDPRAKKQIIAINQIILKSDSLTMERENEKIRTAAFNNALPLYEVADANRLQGKYPEAYTKYSEFLSKIDMPGLTKYSAMQAYQIKQAKDFLGRLERYKPDLVADSLRKAHITDSLNNLNSGRKRKKKKN